MNKFKIGDRVRFSRSTSFLSHSLDGNVATIHPGDKLEISDIDMDVITVRLSNGERLLALRQWIKLSHRECLFGSEI